MGRGRLRGGTARAAASLSGFVRISQAVRLSQPGIVISAAVAQTGAMRVEGKARQDDGIDVGRVDDAICEFVGHSVERARRFVQSMGKRLWIG